MVTDIQREPGHAHTATQKYTSDRLFCRIVIAFSITKKDSKYIVCVLLPLLPLSHQLEISKLFILRHFFCWISVIEMGKQTVNIMGQYSHPVHSVYKTVKTWLHRHPRANKNFIPIVQKGKPPLHKKKGNKAYLIFLLREEQRMPYKSWLWQPCKYLCSQARLRLTAEDTVTWELGM